MKKIVLLWTVVSLVSLSLLSGCASHVDVLAASPATTEPAAPSTEAPSDPGAGAEMPEPAAAGERPEQVVEGFYTWYFESLEEGINPVASKVYQSHELLTPELVSKIDGIVASFDKGGYDPFVCAQDVPQIWSVRTIEETDDAAKVIFHETWMGSYREVPVTLTRDGESWMISDVSCPDFDVDSIGTPEYVVRTFYNWHLEYARHVGNPLVDRAYKYGPLSEEFLVRVEEILASPGPGRFDPILLAQDIPSEVTVGAAEVDGDTATVTVQEFFSGTPREIVVTLEKAEWGWQIVDITAPDMS